MHASIVSTFFRTDVFVIILKLFFKSVIMIMVIKMSIFRFFKEIKLNNSIKQVQRYIDNVVSDPSMVAFHDKKVAELLEEKQSILKKRFQKEQEESDVLYSQRDNYDPDKFESLMRDLNYNNSFNNNQLNVGTSFEDVVNATFSERVFQHIENKGKSDVEVYTSANLDRKLFSKIRTKNYQPSKDTAIALALALQLTLEDSLDLLSRAGFTLSHSNKRDLIIEFFIKQHKYDLNELNLVLYRFNEKTIGR